MNDLLNDIIKPQNIEELYQSILLIVTLIYNVNAPNSVKIKKIRIKQK